MWAMPFGGLGRPPASKDGCALRYNRALIALILGIK
jgi:hypothetical protein